MNEKKPQKLKYILTELVSNARLSPGVPFSKHLKNGLVIQVSFGVKQYLLTLRRGMTIPSESEWKTVINNWPYPVSAMYQRHDSLSGGSYLSGFVPDRTGFQYHFELPTEEP